MSNIITPKENAIQLCEKFNLSTGLMSSEIKECAKILLSEIKKHSTQCFFPIENGHWLDKETYYMETLKEIETL